MMATAGYDFNLLDTLRTDLTDFSNKLTNLRTDNRENPRMIRQSSQLTVHPQSDFRSMSLPRRASNPSYSGTITVSSTRPSAQVVGRKTTKQVHLKSKMFDTLDILDESPGLFNGRNNMAQMLLPTNSYILYSQKEEIYNDLNLKIEEEKKKLSSIFDEFLKSIIISVEKYKEKKYQELELRRKEFSNLYASFLKETDHFVSTSVTLLNKKKAEQRAKIPSIDNPIEAKIAKLVAQKGDAEEIEHIFRNIKKDYSARGIDQMKEQIDQKMSNNLIDLEAITRLMQSAEKKFTDYLNDDVYPEVGRKVTLNATCPSQFLQRNEELDSHYPDIFSPKNEENQSIWRRESSTDHSILKKIAPQNIPIIIKKSEVKKEEYLPINYRDEEETILHPTFMMPKLINAKIDESKTEIHIPFVPYSPQCKILAKFKYSEMAGEEISCIRALDNERVAVGFKNGLMKIHTLTESSSSVDYSFPAQIKDIVQVDSHDLIVLAGDVIECVLQDGKKRMRLCGTSPESEISCFLYSSKALTIICGTSDGKLTLFGLNSPAPMSSTPFFQTKISALCLMQADRTLLIGSGSSISITGLAVEGEVRLKDSLSLPGQISKIGSFLKRNTFFYTVISQNIIKIYDIGTLRYELF